MKLFVGLGNIGSEYDGTRHNIGFDVVGSLEQHLDRSMGWKAGNGDYYFAKGVYRGEDVVVVKPTTFMNLSGRAIRQVMQFYKIEISDLIVICDDLAIPFGALRLRLQGSDGGHNGLTSVIYELGSDQFARLRCGVGANFRKGEQVRYVLSPFKREEKPEVLEMIDRAVVACRTIIEDGLSIAMNKVNFTPAKPEVEKPEVAKPVKPKPVKPKPASANPTSDTKIDKDSGNWE
jgi:PTH1 family peptidyl-tRNA hydrolase